MNHKDRILLELLNQYLSAHIYVTDIRDQFIKQCGDKAMDPAATRRWINGKFMTLVNKGVLTRVQLPNSKKHFFQKTDKFNLYFSKQSKSQEHKDTLLNKFDAPSPTQIAPNVILQNELEVYRQTMLSQLAEIEEYRRIRKEHPQLSEAATTQFKQVADENYRMLGKIRALEKLISSTAA